MLWVFICSCKIFIWIDLQVGWFCVDVGSLVKVEEVIEYLCYCFDEFLLIMFYIQFLVIVVMIDWLVGGDVLVGFIIDCDCELKVVGEEKVVVCYVCYLFDGDEIGGEIKVYLVVGKLLICLVLIWDDWIFFVFIEKLEVKCLVFFDLFKEEVEKSVEYVDEQFDVDFVLMIGEFVCFLL